MPDTRGLGQFFWHRIRLRTDAPRHHRHETHEYEWPYRWANSHVFRLARNFGVVVGWWQGGELEEESEAFEAHLNQALHGRTHTTNAESYKPITTITYVNYTALPDGDEDRDDATRTFQAVDA